jgi:hypothetical protein
MYDRMVNRANYPIIASLSHTSPHPGLSQPFPRDYNQAIRQAQQATKTALQDGATLIEVEFPSATLSSVPGDAEGVNEMNFSLNYLRQYLRVFQPQATTTRIFFPDEKELQVAQEGINNIDPNAGSWTQDAVFSQTNFILDFLSKPNGFLDLGLSLGGVDVAGRVQPTDKTYIIAYPHFDPREMIAVEELWQKAAKESNRPIIVFNGELDRIRSGYYPSLFYPKIGKLAKNFIPLFETAYYIHNFKGAGGGILFRSYPGDWQVLVRGSSSNRDTTEVVHTQATMPSLKEVALDILPKAQRARKRVF